MLKIEDEAMSNSLHLEDCELWLSKARIIHGENKLKMSATICSQQPECETVSRGVLSRFSSVSLRGNQSIDLTNTSLNGVLSVSGKNNLLSGSASLSDKIVLADSDTELSLQLQSKLDKNIVLNESKIVLASDLKLKDGVTIENAGVIDINNFRLSLPSKCPLLSSRLRFLNARDILLSGITTLSGAWFFDGSGASSYLNGAGNILDLSGGGVINVMPNHELNICNTYIKGLGVGGGSIIIDPTSTVKFLFSVVEFDSVTTFTSGIMNFCTPNCKLVFKDDSKILIAGPNAKFNVDGVNLYFETIGNAPVYPPPFLPYAGGSINLFNGGKINNVNFDIFNGTYNFTLSTAQGDNYITGNIGMTGKTVVRFVNENTANVKNMALNGTGKIVDYKSANLKSVILDQNVRLTVKNLTLNNLDFTALDLQGTGTAQAQFYFGEGITFSMGKDLTVAQMPVVITGNVVLEGNNFNLTINQDNRVIVADGASLTVRNSYFRVMGRECIQCLGVNSKIIFDNSSLEISPNGLDCDEGCFEFKNSNSIFCSKSASASANLNFTSKGTIKLNPNSTLKISSGINFIYAPTPNLGESQISLKSRFFMADGTSTVELRDSTLDISSCGMRLDAGNLLINNKVFVNQSSLPGREFDMSYDNLNFVVGNSAIFEFNGILNVY